MSPDCSRALGQVEYGAEFLHKGLRRGTVFAQCCREPRGEHRKNGGDRVRRQEPAGPNAEARSGQQSVAGKRSIKHRLTASRRAGYGPQCEQANADHQYDAD